ncbi:hypothetical protein B0J14DRAFT_347182 [Halenospora varia]|nr:hypothetical protein B0J14DRAFT_347182 [Halenospora varia]
MDHFVNYVVPHWKVYYPRSKSEPEYQQGMILRWLPLAITQPIIMIGRFFAACRSLALLLDSSSYLCNAFKYSGAFIRSINETIFEDEGSVKDSTIVKIWLLASSEVETSYFGVC